MNVADINNNVAFFYQPEAETLENLKKIGNIY